MLCAELVATDAGYVVRQSGAQPADPSGCALVLVEGGDVAALQLFKTPTATEFAVAWAWGFSLVVGVYVAAWAAGALLNSFKR